MGFSNVDQRSQCLHVEYKVPTTSQTINKNVNIITMSKGQDRKKEKKKPKKDKDKK